MLIFFSEIFSYSFFLSINFICDYIFCFYILALTVEKEDLTNVKLLSGSTSDLHKLGIQKHTPPRQPKHATFEGRLRTFQAWPENIRQTPDMLATAGFYYVGKFYKIKSNR